MFCNAKLRKHSFCSSTFTAAPTMESSSFSSPSCSSQSLHTSSAGLKRSPSCGSSNSLGTMHSALRSPKKWRTNEEGAAACCAGSTTTSKVSFGSLNETILFDRQDSSSQLKTFRRAAVSDLSFGSTMSFTSGVKASGSFRWGEQAAQHNATWGPPAKPTANARWSTNFVPPPQPRTNMLLQSTGFATMSPPPPPAAAGAPSPMLSPLNMSVHSASSQFVRLPQRCASPSPLPHVDPMQVSLSSFSSTSDFAQTPTPQQADGCPSPMSILPQPLSNGDETPANWNAFQAPPKRPVRSRSPAPMRS